MNFNNYTIKSQEAIQKATEIAASLQQQAVETGQRVRLIFTKLLRGIISNMAT